MVLGGRASTPSVADEMVAGGGHPHLQLLMRWWCLLSPLPSVDYFVFWALSWLAFFLHVSLKLLTSSTICTFRSKKAKKSQEEWAWALQASFPTPLSSLGSLHLLDKHTTPLCEVPAPSSTHVLPRWHHFFPNFRAGRLSGCLSPRSTPRGLLDKIKWSFLKAANSTFNSRFSFTLLRQPSLSVAFKFQLSAQLPSFAQLPSLGSVTV